MAIETGKLTAEGHQGVATAECFCTDTRHTLRNGYAGKIPTTREGMTSNACHTLRNGNAAKA